MKQAEADAVAKRIRNHTTIPIGYKEELVNAICYALTEQDQFFNIKRFKDMALMEFPEGWPNKMDRL